VKKLARRVRTDQWLVEGIGASGTQPGRSAGEGRSLLIDLHVDVEPIKGGARMKTAATEGAARSGGGDPKDHPPPETRYGGFE
jgi:hypothetical protein